jgi:hypothetical protein
MKTKPTKLFTTRQFLNSEKENRRNIDRVEKAREA